MSESADHSSVHYRKKALPMGVVRRILRREQQKIYARYAAAFPPRPSSRVLDLGVSASLTTRDHYFFESNYPYPERLVAAGLEDSTRINECFPEIEYVQVARGDGLPFDDQEFDVVFCSAVIEHVGDHHDQKEFLQEILRVGKNAFITTPNRWYPIELHTVTPFLHYLPPSWYRPIYRKLGFTFFANEENLNLLDRKRLLALVPAGVRHTVKRHFFLGLPSNLLLIIDRSSPE